LKVENFYFGKGENKMILVGQIIYGYCEGYFGRDSYGEKIIEAIGANWIVARDIDNRTVSFATFDTQDEMIECIKKWSVKDN